MFSDISYSKRSINLCYEAIHFAQDVLVENGCFVCKFFQGGKEKELVNYAKSFFKVVKTAKPKASRKESAELYLVASGYKPLAL